MGGHTCPFMPLSQHKNLLLSNILSNALLYFSAGKSGDEVVLDMAQEMMRSIPEEIQIEEEESQSARPGKTFVPTLNDMANIAQGALNKVQGSRSGSAVKRKKGMIIAVLQARNLYAHLERYILLL